MTARQFRSSLPAGGRCNSGLSDTTSSVSAEIARECARIQTRYRGRGPSKTRVFLRPDIVVVLMEDTLTTADKTLVAAGKEELVDEMRAEFQATMQTELVD